MTGTAQTLRDLHRIHIQLADVKSRLERGPRRIRAQEAKVVELEQALQQAKERVKQARLQSGQKELQLNERESKIVDIRTKLNACSSNREYQAFLEQIAAHDQANSVLSDEILESYEKTQDLEQSVKDCEQELKVGRDELAQFAAKVAELKAGLESELSRLELELQQTQSQLPDEVRADYQRMARSGGEDALAEVEAEICQGCYQKITSQMWSELLQQRLVLCKSCGRLLYLPEDRRVGS